MTINERFKEIRLNLNKTQADFGEQCGLGRAVIANIENNRSPVTPLYIKVVVDNFGVNEEWLIKGTGDMFLETKEQYIDRLAERYGLDDFMKKVITAYSELSDDEKKVVKDFIKKINEPDPDKKRPASCRTGRISRSRSKGSGRSKQCSEGSQSKAQKIKCNNNPTTS